MKRLIVFLLIASLLFLVPFGAGLGYGLTGSQIQIMPKWAESHNSGSGVAIAVYENNGEISTTNTPPKQIYDAPPMHPLEFITFMSILAVLAFSFWLFVRQIQPVTDTNEPWHNWTHHSSKEAEEWEKFYKENPNG